MRLCCLSWRDVLAYLTKDKRDPKREGTKPVMLDADTKQGIIELVDYHRTCRSPIKRRTLFPRRIVVTNGDEVFGAF